MQKQFKKDCLEDVKVDIKFRLSALWASVTCCYLYGDYFEFYVPGKVEGLVNGQNMLDSPAKLLAATVALAIPALMICLSVLLKPAINKWLNIAAGLFFTAVMVLIACTSWTAWRSFYVLLAIIESVITFFIVWYAFKWPELVESKNAS